MPTTEAQAKFKVFIRTKEVSAWLFEGKVRIMAKLKTANSEDLDKPDERTVGA